MIFTLFCFAAEMSFAQNSDNSIKNINLKTNNGTASELNVNLNEKTSADNSLNIEFFKDDYFMSITDATDKFVLRNIRASREDFENVIKNTNPNTKMKTTELIKSPCQNNFYGYKDKSLFVKYFAKSK